MYLLNDECGAVVAPSKMNGAIRFRQSRMVQAPARFLVKVGQSKVAKCLAVAVVLGVGMQVTSYAQTDATVIATDAQTAFGTIAPITITIAGFYVILRIAKKVVH